MIIPAEAAKRANRSPTDPVDIVLVGAGGYGATYLEALMSQTESRGFRFVGVVDPHAEKLPSLEKLRAREIPLFDSLEKFFEDHRCDLAVLASPIQYHCPQTCVALSHGSHVLCEKPLCASLEQIDLMQAAEDASGKTVAIGYQWSFSPAIQRLKTEIMAGRLGRPLRLRTLVGWPRGLDYYQRNNWAGRQRTKDGAQILDSPVNNAAAHFLHNMLYVLGPSISESAEPQKVEAELWRANPIDNYDTAALRIEVTGGVPIFFYTSHAVPVIQGPLFSYEFEKATVSYEAKQNRLLVTWPGGETVDYGSPEDEPYQKLWNAIESARTGRRPVCGIAAAAAHTRCMLRAQECPPGIRDFPASKITIDSTGASPLRYVNGLIEALNQGYEQGKLFSELTTTDLFETK